MAHINLNIGAYLLLMWWWKSDGSGVKDTFCQAYQAFMKSVNKRQGVAWIICNLKDDTRCLGWNLNFSLTNEFFSNKCYVKQETELLKSRIFN